VVSEAVDGWPVGVQARARRLEEVP